MILLAFAGGAVLFMPIGGAVARGMGADRRHDLSGRVRIDLSFCAAARTIGPCRQRGSDEHRASRSLGSARVQRRMALTADRAVKSSMSSLTQPRPSRES